MFTVEMIESLAFIGVVTVFICAVGVALGWREDRDADSQHVPIDSENQRKTA